MLRSLLCYVLVFISFNIFAGETWITLDNKFLKELPHPIYQIENQNSNISLIRIKSEYVDTLAFLKNSKLGGFITHNTLEEGNKFLFKNFDRICAQIPSLRYSITESDSIPALISQAKESNLVSDIRILSNFYNRHYQTQTGVDSQKWLKNKWINMIKNRSDITIEEFKHSFIQPSIVLTIQGTTNSDEIVILGGHGDSTAGWFGAFNRAPGADDNASGISVLTETLRILIANNYQPSRTLKFISYAGEEGGLLGSQDISDLYKENKMNVLGVLQLDMTNYDASDKDIYLISDFTNAKQNEFLGKLIDKYIKASWGYTECGYGCSDHASWTGNNFVASFPFEGDQVNPNIHISKDILTQNKVSHSVPFVKLAIAYAVEMGK